MNRRWLPRAVAVVTAVVTYGLLPTSAQETSDPQKLVPGDDFPVEHSDCVFFGPQRERFLPAANRRRGFEAGRLTQQFALARAGVARAGGSEPSSDSGGKDANVIDSYINADLKANNITPANKTNDWEFARRVTLDLTGRIPTRENLLQFIASA